MAGSAGDAREDAAGAPALLLRREPAEPRGLQRNAVHVCVQPARGRAWAERRERHAGGAVPLRRMGKTDIEERNAGEYAGNGEPVPIQRVYLRRRDRAVLPADEVLQPLQGKIH